MKPLASRPLQRRLACLAMLATALSAWAGAPGEVPVGGLLETVRMQGLAGPPGTFEDYRGKPLLVNVWASWCGPCQQEMGSLNRLFQRYGGREFNLIGISTDDHDRQARAFLVRTQSPFRHYIDRNLVLEHLLGADRLPLTVLVDAQGRVLQRIYGARPWDSPESIALLSQVFGQPLRSTGPPHKNQNP